MLSLGSDPDFLGVTGKVRSLLWMSVPSSENIEVRGCSSTAELRPSGRWVLATAEEIDVQWPEMPHDFLDAPARKTKGFYELVSSQFPLLLLLQAGVSTGNMFALKCRNLSQIIS